MKKMVLKINQNLDKNYLKNAFQKAHVLLKLQAISLDRSLFADVLRNRRSYKILKIHRTIPLPEPLF